MRQKFDCEVPKQIESINFRNKKTPTYLTAFGIVISFKTTAKLGKSLSYPIAFCWNSVALLQPEIYVKQNTQHIISVFCP